LRQHSHPQYDAYKRIDKFKTFRLDHGNIVWGSDWDLIFPIEQLYNGCIS
jgi:hypothetical protein